MIQLFVLPGNLSCRKAQQHLLETGNPFVLRDLRTSPMSFEELKQILAFSEEGTDELLAVRSFKYLELKRSGFDFDELSLREFHQLLMSYPALVRTPIALGDDLMMVGYQEETYNVFKPRHLRMQEQQAYLDILRADEDIRFAEKLAQEEEQLEAEYEPSI